MKIKSNILFAALLVIFGASSCAEKLAEPAPTPGLIKLSDTEKVIFVGKKYQMTAEITPVEVADATIEWSVVEAPANPEETQKDAEPVITISETGLITAVSVGKAKIAAKAGTVTAYANITVAEPYVSTLTLDQTDLSLELEGAKSQYQLIVTENPEFDEELQEMHFKWSSSDPSVATVEKGLVKAVKMGFTDITLEVLGKEAVCHVAVVGTEPVLMPQETNLYYGEEVTLNLALPATYKDKEISWQADENFITLTVDEANKAKAHISAAGTTEETTVSATVGDKTLECKVKVVAIAHLDLKKFSDKGSFAAEIKKLDALGIKDYVLAGPFANSGIEEGTSKDSWKNPFAATGVVSIDFSGVTGWPKTKIKLPNAKIEGEYVGAGKTFNTKFGAFNSLKKVIFPAEVEILGRYAFGQCKVLEEVYAPGAKYFHKDAFYACPSLAMLRLTAPGELKFGTGSESLFNGCKAENLKKCTLVLNSDKQSTVAGLTYFGFEWKEIKFE